MFISLNGSHIINREYFLGERSFMPTFHGTSGTVIDLCNASELLSI